MIFFSTGKHIAFNKLWDLWYMKRLRVGRQIIVEYFYALVNVHPCIILSIKPNWCTIYS